MRIALLAFLFLAASAFAADDKPVVKEIPTKDLTLTFPVKGTGTSKPDVFTSADDVAKSPVLQKAAEAIGKQVDFKKEKLVVFTWSGSGQDKSASEAKMTDGKTTVSFSYTAGKTRDLRQHVHLFVVPKDAEVKRPVASSEHR